MRVVLAMMLQLLKLCIIFLSVAVPRSKGSTVSPSPAFLPVIPSLGSNAPSLPLLPHGLVVPPSPARGSWTNIAPSSPEVANGSFLLPPDALPLPASAPTPQKHDKDIEPSTTPSPTTIALSPPPHEVVPLPSTPQGNAPLTESAASPPWKAEHNPSPPPPEAHPISPSILPAPVASPASSFPANPPLVHPIIPSTLPVQS
ncbi:vegetative cell wall protein gp1-like [Arachis ipaensis]|uniref:vegetative cell wall protein gp1-like n=1 Tax=Arachis ipaensis TaxID=130454 RepID=UPI0007AF822B|nr:vegetative cell wall protein gp1-like [Arachis ipaensis]